MAGMDLSSITKECLALAYPCSVDGGVDGEKYCLALYNWREEFRGEQHHDIFANVTDALRKALDWDGSELEGKTRDEVKKRAKELNEGKWRHTRSIDKTDMKSDYSEVEKLLKVCKLRNNANSQVIDEFRDEHVSDIRSRLTYVNTDYPDIHQFTVLCIIGHGLSESMASSIRDTRVWRWIMYDCQEKNGIGKTEEEVKEQAEKGDIVVFSSGFLSPDWVIERLRERDSKGVRSTLVMVMDSCHGGVWTRKISDSLRAKPLAHTRVIVQTACGENEKSYGGIFWPSFRALQECDKSDLIPLEAASEPAAPDAEPPLQTPTFFVSDNSDTPYTRSTREVELGGTKLRFFADGKFFEKFCDKAFYDNSRGIPDDDLEPFFKSFDNEEENEIRCYKLKLDRRHEPMAFILVRWSRSLPKGEKQYHLHLHFKKFPCTLHNLESISHVDTTACSRPFASYEREELDPERTTKRIRKRDPTRAWLHIERSSLVKKCIEKVANSKRNWDDPRCWHMTNTEPPNIIRSRSAMLQELIGYP